MRRLACARRLPAPPIAHERRPSLRRVPVRGRRWATSRPQQPRVAISSRTACAQLLATLAALTALATLAALAALARLLLASHTRRLVAHRLDRPRSAAAAERLPVHLARRHRARRPPRRAGPRAVAPRAATSHCRSSPLPSRTTRPLLDGPRQPRPAAELPRPPPRARSPSAAAATVGACAVERTQQVLPTLGLVGLGLKVASSQLPPLVRAPRRRRRWGRRSGC